MKLHTDTHKAEGSGFNKAKQFKIAMNAKAARVLSSTLYSDKPGAIIRELSCNAFDAHRAAGNPETPFDITLPDAFEPRLVIRDYGTGISPKDIDEVYTVFFGSTKDQDNLDVGALGLGSKTPLAYTDSFMVTSIYQGVKRIYNVFRDEGMPSTSEFGDGEKTDEPDGLEVSVTIKREDFTLFENAVRRQLRFFPVKPNIVGRNVVWPKIVDTIVEVDGFQYFKHNDQLLKGFFIKQGPVAYPVDFNLLDSHYRNKLNRDTPAIVSFLAEFNNDNRYYFGSGNQRFGAVLDMPIGTVDVNPGREGVSYDDETLNNIVAAMDRVADSMFKTVSKNFHSAYKKGFADFSDYYKNLSDYMQGVVDAGYVEKHFKPFTVKDGALRILLDKKYSGVVVSKYNSTYRCTKVKVTETIKTGEFPGMDDNDDAADIAAYEKSDVRYLALNFLFGDDPIYIKDEAYAFVARAELDCDSGRFIMVDKDDVADDVFEDFIKFLEKFRPVTRVSETEKPSRTRTGRSKATQKRAWFKVKDATFRSYNAHISGDATLYRMDCLSEYDETVEDYTGDEKVYMFTKNNVLTSSFELRTVMPVVMRYASKVLGMVDGFIAIPENMRKKAEDNDNLISIEDFIAKHSAAIIDCIKHEISSVDINGYNGNCSRVLTYRTKTELSELDGLEQSDFNFDQVVSDADILNNVQPTALEHFLVGQNRGDLYQKIKTSKSLPSYTSINELEDAFNADDVNYNSFTGLIDKIEKAMLDPVNAKKILRSTLDRDTIYNPSSVIRDPYNWDKELLDFGVILNKIIDKIS